MSFRDQEEQEEHFHRNRHWIERKQLEEASKQPPKRSGAFWKAPHEEAPYPTNESRA